ncbi:MAG: HD domain-containing phosphohydrolase [Vulcanimicrobiota bacterium]
MKRSLKSVMLFWIWGITALIFVLGLYFNFEYAREQQVEEIKKDAYVLGEMYEEKFENLFAAAMTMPGLTAVHLESLDNYSPQSIKKYLEKAVNNNPDIYGACISFTPHATSEQRKLFAPYCYRNKENILFTDLGNEDYNYLNKEWFKTPAETGIPRWSAPYFDEGGGEILMTTYSVPFYKNGKLMGITTSDISLEELTREIQHIKLMKTGYGFIVNDKGTFIAYPDRSKILEGNINNLNPQLARQLLSGTAGYIKTLDPLRNEEAWIAFYPIKIAGFYLGLVYPQDEILSQVYALQQRFALVGSVGLIVLFMVIMAVSNSITHPLSKLVDSTRKVAGGDLDHHIDINTRTAEVCSLEKSFNKMIDELNEHINQLNEANQAKQKLFVSSIIALANAIEARDEYTRGHSERVTDISVRIAQKMGMDKKEIENLRYAALLHDIGKIKIKENVLNKPGKLNDDEFAQMKEHPGHGAKILEPVLEFKTILPFIYHHHEKYDKTGYPDKLGGENIPLASRILAVADSFDAMTSNRPYRSSQPLSFAVEQLKKGKGTQFDPQVVDIFMEIIEKEGSWLKSVMQE